MKYRKKMLYKAIFMSFMVSFSGVFLKTENFKLKTLV